MKQQIAKAAEIYKQTAVPNLPNEIIQLKEELNKKYPNTVTIANLISHNPELLGDFLSLVNTNITNESGEFKEAKAAVNVLGLDEIYNIFLASSLTNILAQSPQEKQILEYGAQVGLAAAELSYWVYDVSRSEAYMAGLMQNIGAVYLSRTDPETYMEILKGQMTNPITGYEKEEKTYGTTHAYLGTLVAKKWHISEDVYKSILLHHDPEFALKTGSNQKVKHLVALTFIANYVVSVNSDDQYTSKEIKDYMKMGLTQINLPDNAIKAAHSAVIKWGKSAGLGSSSH